MSNSFPSPGNRPLDHLKVAELREELRKRGLSLKGVKKYLFERLDEAIQEKQACFVGDNEGHGAYPSEFFHHRDSLAVSHDDDARSCSKDTETTQNTSLTLINASPYAGALYATRMFMEPHKHVDGVLSMEERRKDVTKTGFGSIAEVAEGKKRVTNPENTLIKENNSVEPMVVYDDRVIENVSQLGNQGSRTKAVVGDGVNNENTDPKTSFLENIVLPSFTGEVGAPDSVTASQDVNTNKILALELSDVTHSASVQDCAVAGVVGSSIEQEISVPEVISPSDVVVPSEGDKDGLNKSVSDDFLNAASPCVLPTVETVVNANDCLMQDVEVFETTFLTSVSFVACVQEPGKDPDNNGLNIGIYAIAKGELVEEDTAGVLLQEGGEAMDLLGAAAELPLLKAVQELQVPAPEGIDGRAGHTDLIARKDEQGIEMVEAHKDIPAKAADLKIRLPAAASEPGHAIKSENIDDIRLGDGDSEDLKEIPKVGIMEDHKLDVRPGPSEAELRVSERAEALEMVKVEQYDGEELLQKERSLDRFRPRDYEADQPRDHEHDWFSHNSVRLLNERGQQGQQFREDGRNHIEKLVFKSGDGMDVHTSQKRKDNDGDAKQQKAGKRMRRWSSGNQPVMEVAKPLTSGNVNEIISPEVKREGTVASPKLTKKLPGPLKPAQPAAKPAYEANREKRMGPSSTRPPSASLKIERFVRPFTLKAVKNLLAEFGDCVDFWMDHIKTHCYVTFSKVEEAVAAQNGLHYRQWPPSFGTPLIANFVDASEVKLRSDGIFDKTYAPALTSPNGIQNDRSASGAQHGRANPLARASLRERQQMQPLNKDPDPPVLTLDDLFQKTKAKPHIYYLPLLDEQVAEKPAVLQNEKTAAQRKNNQWPVNVRPVWRVQ